MSIKVSPELANALRNDSLAFAMNGGDNGLPKTIYYTPDGRIIRAIAQMRGYVVKDKDGKVTGTGRRDANLDQGWLSTRPTVLYPYCPGCDRWHENLTLVEACIVKQKAYLARMELLAKKELHQEREAKDSTIESLSKQVADLKIMVEKLIGVKV